MSEKRKLVFDIETNGLLDQLDTIHSLCIGDFITGETWSFCDQPGYEPIACGVKMLEDAEWVCGHNIINFDLPAIKKVYPDFKEPEKVYDTIVMARMFFPDIKGPDTPLVANGTLPRKLMGSYSLEAFGYRLGLWKGDYSDKMKEQGIDPWAFWNKDMQDYCELDVAVTLRLMRNLRREWTGGPSTKKINGQQVQVQRFPHSDASVDLEMQVARIVSRQERWGFSFDVKAAEKLYVDLLAERDRLEAELKKTFKPWWASGGLVHVKKTRRVSRKDLPPIAQRTKRNGTVELIYPKEIYEEGSVYTKLERREFNPNSGHHITDRLKALFGWEPQEFTDSGQAKTDETTLSGLPWPEVQLLTEYMTIAKRIGQVAEGRNAWLKKERNGRIHGSVKTTGAVTRRMTHSDPNVAQVPKVGKPWGKECRACFKATPGFVLVGCDADALELRCLAGYLAPFDGGVYIDTVLKGDKSLGTDMHSVNCRALGMDPKGLYTVGAFELSGRDIAKTFYYAWAYGGGDYKLGTVLGATGTDREISARGSKARADFLRGLPALGKLIDAVNKRAFGKNGRGFLYGLDGGKIRTRHKHAALNTLLQSAGAIIMKKALVILDSTLQGHGLVPGKDYEFTGNVHDEWIIDARPECAELVRVTAEESIKAAGEVLNFACPLQGQGEVGNTWGDVH